MREQGEPTTSKGLQNYSNFPMAYIISHILQIIIEQTQRYQGIKKLTQSNKSSLMADIGFESGSISIQSLCSFQYTQSTHREWFETSLLQDSVNVKHRIQ